MAEHPLSLSQEVTALRDLVNARIEALDRATELRFISAEKAVDAAFEATNRAVAKAEAATERRFEGVNEFRASLNDQTRTMMPRAEYETAHKALNDKVDQLAKLVAAREDRGQGIGQTWGWIVAGIGLIASVVMAIIAFGSRVGG